jgi:hypothetical protein
MYLVIGTRRSDEILQQADAWSAHQRQRAQAHGMNFIYFIVIHFDDKSLEAQEQIQETFTEEVYEQNY